MPSQERDINGRRQWDLNKITTEKKITTLTIPTYKFFGLYELLNDKNFQEGRLVVDEDNTSLCFMDRSIFMTNLTELEREKLVKEPDAYVEYAKDEEMQVKVAAEKKMRRLHAETMLDAMKVSGDPHIASGRVFDQKLVRESPTKNSFKWAQQFAIESKLSA